MTQSTANYKANSRRRGTAIIAIILIFAMLIAGTFAWQSISQQALNQTIGLPAPAGGRLHDDFEVVGARHGMMQWRQDLQANKDVYVENFENSAETFEEEGLEGSFVGRDIFTRVRIFEYMELGAGARRLPEDDNYASRLTSYEGESTGTVVPLVPGTNRDDRSTWIPFVPEGMPRNDSRTAAFRRYWTVGQGGWKYYMPTFNRDPMSLMSDTKGHAVDPQHDDLVAALEPANPTRSVEQGGTAPQAFPPEAGGTDGGHNFFAPAAPGDDPAEHTSVRKFWNEDFGSGDGMHDITAEQFVHTARRTIDGSVVSMETWLSWPEVDRVGPFWVFDADGWAYWAQPLAPQTATGLLIDYITLHRRPVQEWYHGIFIDSQMATAEEWRENAVAGNQGWFHPNAGPAPSADAVTLLEFIIANTFDATLTVAPATANVVAGQQREFTATITAGGEPQSAAAVSWEILTDTVHANTTLTAAAGASTTLQVALTETSDTITIRARRPGGMYTDITVTVVPPGPASGIDVGETFTSGVVWEVLAIDANNNRLIITQDVHGDSTRYSEPNQYVRLGSTNNGLRQGLNTWWGTLPTEITERALSADNVNEDIRDNYGGADWATENDWTGARLGFTTPGDDPVEPNGSNALFVLSISEINQFIGTTPASRVATSPGGEARSWWTRSPGPFEIVGVVAVVNEAGTFIGSSSTFMASARGFRAAMWVSP